MNYSNTDKVLTIYLEGQISATNASEIEQELKQIISQNPSNEIILNAKKLEYISSAGLRVILALAKEHKELRIDQASRDSYEIFEMTGFTNFLTISKALREVSVEGCPIIGEGATAYVYRLNEDTIVKVFKDETRTVERVKEEIDQSKRAFVYGVPTAISFDIVQVGTHLGVVFEMLEAKSLCDLMKDDLPHLDKYIDMLVDLLNKLKATDASDSNIQKVETYYLKQLEDVKGYLDQPHYEKMKKYLEALPKDKGTLVHGDFHIKNILIQNKEPLLIDMDTVSVGNQIFEFASTYVSYIAYQQGDEGNALKFFGIPDEKCVYIYKETIRKFFSPKNEEEFNEILLKIQAVGSLRMLYFCFVDKEKQFRFDYAIKGLYEALDKIDNLII